MFWNIYSKRLLSCLRNKDQLIWIWAFPLILATLFYFTLSSVGEADNLKAIPTGVVTESKTQNLIQINDCPLRGVA